MSIVRKRLQDNGRTENVQYDQQPVMLLLIVLIIASAAFGKVTWSPWSSWSTGCPRLCSDSHGFQHKRRFCLMCHDDSGCFPSERPSVTSFCEGQPREHRACYIGSQCQGPGLFTGEWTGWLNLGGCRTNPERRCGEVGIQRQTRQCQPTVKTDKTTTFQCPANDRLRSFKQKACVLECPDDLDREKRAVVVAYGEWTTWSAWMCNEDCHNPGVLAFRSRQCSGESLGYTCVKGTHGLGEYDVLPCESTDGYLCRKSWSDWSPWSECEPECGQRKKTRTRSCMGHGGPCDGSPEQSILCSSGPPCSRIDGQWGKWSMWSQVCSTSCGGGVYTRYRECNNPSPLGAGKPCLGKSMETKPCEKASVCPVDGSWGQWSAWSCAATCGTSPGTRYRECNNPSPSPTGNTCSGKNQETKADVCNYFICPQNGTAPTLPEELRNEVTEDLKRMYNNYDKVEHQSVAFVCGTPAADKIKEAYPRTSTFWVKNGQPFKLDPSRMTYDNGDLLIQSVVAADIGVYLCQLEWQPKLRQTVAVYALVVKSSFKLHTRQHRNLQLYCNGASLGLLYAGLQQIWFHNGEIYKDYGTTPPQTINVEYFEDIGSDFAGLWECTINDPSSMRLWITNRVNVTVGGGVYFIERLLSSPAYLVGCGAVVLATVVGIAVCCLYQDKKGDQNAETEAEVYEQLMKENPSILDEEKEEEKPRRVKLFSAAENDLTESSSFVSDEGLQLKDGGTVHTNVR